MSRIRRRIEGDLIQREPGDGDKSDGDGTVYGKVMQYVPTVVSDTIYNWTVGWYNGSSATGTPSVVTQPLPPTKLVEKSPEKQPEKKPEKQPEKSAKKPANLKPDNPKPQNEVGKKDANELKSTPSTATGKSKNARKKERNAKLLHGGTTSEVAETHDTVDTKVKPEKSATSHQPTQGPTVEPTTPKLDVLTSQTVSETKSEATPQPVKQSAADKKRAAKAAADEKLRLDKEYCAEKVVTLTARVQLAKDSARSFKAGKPTDVNRLFSELVPKKTAPADLRLKLDELESAIDAALAKHQEVNDKNKHQFDGAVGAVREQVSQVVAAAKKRKIETTSIDSSATAMELAAKSEVPNWVDANEQLSAAAKAANAVQLLLDDAATYDSLKESALASAATSKKDAELLQSQPVPTDQEAGKYFAILKLSVTWLDESLTKHADLAATEPDWPELLGAIKSVARSAERVQREITVAPLRPKGLVGGYGTDTIEVQKATEIKGDGEPDEVEALKIGLASLYRTDLTWKTEIVEAGGEWGSHHGNFKSYLPVAHSDEYSEYYLRKPASAATKWGSRRLVANADRSRVYYSWTHYGDNGKPAFVMLG
ncbi:MAG: hypothetical protein ABIQ39_15695 [Ilumatobacteraceae bacterium]